MVQAADDCPVLLIYFNRPDVLERNLRSLSSFRPRRLFLASDGPRQGNPDDVEKLDRSQRLISDIVTWDCDLRTQHRPSNVGADHNVPLAIDWFFSQVDRGIVLEDDCLISSSFFRFASELLEDYRDAPKVMNISAANFQNRRWGDGDYYFSNYPSNWGWATWSRAWQQFDRDVKGVEDFLSDRLRSFAIPADETHYWSRFFRRLRDGKYTYWDAKWVYSIWNAGGLSITPNINLVNNVGFGPDATHTRRITDGMDVQVGELTFPLRKPSAEFEISSGADRYLFDSRYRPKISGRIEAVLRRILRRH